MQLIFENIKEIGKGKFPDFVQFPKTDGELFFIKDGLMKGIPSTKFNGNFSNPTWLDQVDIGPKGDINISNLGLRTLSGFGIIGSYKTDTTQKLIIYEYLFEMDKYLQGATIKHSMDTPISSFTLSLENPLNENPEYEGNVAISEEISLLSPGSKVVFEFSLGDSEEYSMGTFYVDRSNFSLLDESVNVDGRNIIGKVLYDQTFDEENIYHNDILHETIRSILLKANIVPDEALVEETTIHSGYRFEPTMTYLDGILEILKAMDNWKIVEQVDGTVVIGSKNYVGFTQNSSYIFQRNKDLFSRKIIKDDGSAYRRVCIHNSDFSIRIYKDVDYYSGWNLQENKTLYVNIPDGTSVTDAKVYASQIAENLQYVGKVESFTGPFRPQIILGDEAVIVGENGSIRLGLITEIVHRFGKEGFYTDFTVDSGGVLGVGRLGDYINQITKSRNSSSRNYE